MEKWTISFFTPNFLAFSVVNSGSVVVNVTLADLASSLLAARTNLSRSLDSITVPFCEGMIFGLPPESTIFASLAVDLNPLESALAAFTSFSVSRVISTLLSEILNDAVAASCPGVRLAVVVPSVSLIGPETSGLA